MFDNANVGGDTMVETLSTLFRLPPNGVPMTIMQLAGFPAEVVDSVVSVLLRMAFEFGLWSDGAFPLLVVCEEAHRYAPADRSIGFGPTRKAVSRIAKEGRKYGVFLGLITQRPAELDATIISQCSTLFAMRMANDRDQAIVRSAVSDAAGSLIGFVPSLGTREVFAFGEGVALPTRLRFKQLDQQHIPHSRGGHARQHGFAPRASMSASSSRWSSAGAAPRMGNQTRARPSGGGGCRRSRRYRRARGQRVLARCGRTRRAGAGHAARRRRRSFDPQERDDRRRRSFFFSGRTSAQTRCRSRHAEVARPPPSAASRRA